MIVANINSGAYNVFLLLHILAAIVAVGPATNLHAPDADRHYDPT